MIKYMKKEKYAVFLDIDNTLLYNGKIPQSNIDAIKQVRSQGSYVFINTARSYAFVPDSLKDLSLFDGIVAGIGTDIRFGEKRILSEIISVDDLKEITARFMGDRREIGYEGESVMLWINPSKGRNAEYYVHSPDDFDSVYKDCRISKMYIGDGLTGEENEFFGRKNIMYSHAHYAEFVKKGFGKAEGMKRMLDFLRIPRERCIAMGDSSNDADMLSAAGTAVAMGNAIDEIKAMSDFVSCHAKDGGVAYALKKLILE